MARLVEPTVKMEKGWRRWVKSRPPSVRAVAEKLDPWTLYRMKDTGQYVTVASIFEDGSVSVNVTSQFNFVLHERNVFGIDPATLEECDIPTEEGVALLTQEQVDENIDALRVMVRPDLWVMDEDGKARRKT